MASTNPQDDGYKVIEKRCRISMDVTIRISEITPESVASYFTPDEAGEESLTWEWAERQNRLLLMLLQDKEALDQFLVNITREELEMLTQSEHDPHAPTNWEDGLYERVYFQMGSEDALFFQEAKKDGIRYENTQLVEKAFVIDW